MSGLSTRLAALVFLASLTLTACSNATGDGPITFMISGDPQELAAYQELVDQFTAGHPDIQVDMIYVASQGEYRERLATMFSGNRPPDVFLYNYRRLGTYAEDGAVHPLGDLLDASDVIAPEDFYPIALDAFTYRGTVQCIPQNISSPVIYYNPVLFDAAGLAYPRAGWDLDEFLASAAALTRDLDGDGSTDQWGFGTEIETIRLAPFIWANGGDFFDNPQNPADLTLDAPAARAAIEWFLDLQLAHQVAPDIVAETTQSATDRFLNGSLAMFVDSRVVVPALRTITAFKWDAGPLPLGDSFANVLHSDGFCLSARAAADELRRDRAWTFIEYALSETGQILLAATGRTVPSMIRVAESPAFLDSIPPANNRVWLDAAETMRALPMIPGWNQFEEMLSVELQRAFYGDGTMEEFLVKAKDLAAPMFEE